MRIAVWLTHDTVGAWNFQPRHVTRLAGALPDVEVAVAANRDDFLSALTDAKIALIWRFEDEWFATAPRLEWVCTPAAGRDLFRVRPPAGVTIEYGAFHGELMAETVIGMMLAFTRGIIAADRLRAVDSWPLAQVESVVRPLRGSHLVILGFGAIGRWIGRLASALGVRITGVRRDAASSRPGWMQPADRQIGVDRLDVVLPTADHLVLALPGEGTRHVLDARRLALLPPSAFVYNVGRGSAVDEQALAAALAAGELAGAGLDVFEVEPLSATSPLRGSDRVLILPHSSAIAPNYLDLFIDEFVARYQRRYPREVAQD